MKETLSALGVGRDFQIEDAVGAVVVPVVVPLTMTVTPAIASPDTDFTLPVMSRCGAAACAWTPAERRSVSARLRSIRRTCWVKFLCIG